MKRNMMKIAGKGWKGIPARYELEIENYLEVKEMVFAEGAPPNVFFHAVGIVFRYGFELGRRYEKRHGAQAEKKA